MTINVVAVNGAQSFSPNPATLPAGQMVVWHNVDSITHRVVLNDRSVDTGDLAPGASSQPMAIAAAGGQYHCSIHPVMVGSVNQNTSNVPAPCQGAYYATEASLHPRRRRRERARVASDQRACAP